MSVWDQISYFAGKAGSSIVKAANRTRIRTEMALVDREKTSRIQAFGLEMYNYLDPLTNSDAFWSGTDVLTELLRGPLIVAQREIKALTNRLAKLKEDYNQALTKRDAAFATKAKDWQDRLKNAGKATVLTGNEQKIKTEIYVVETEILAEKHNFGISLFVILSKKEDEESYVPSEREVRKIFDTARSDISTIEKKKKEMDKELVALGGSSVYATTTSESIFSKNYATSEFGCPRNYATPIEPETSLSTNTYSAPSSSSVPVNNIQYSTPSSSSVPVNNIHYSTHSSSSVPVNNIHYSTSAPTYAPPQQAFMTPTPPQQFDPFSPSTHQ